APRPRRPGSSRADRRSGGGRGGGRLPGLRGGVVRERRGARRPRRPHGVRLARARRRWSARTRVEFNDRDPTRRMAGAKEKRANRRGTGASAPSRRAFLKQAGAAGLAAAGAPLLRPRVSVAAPVTLSMWSCFPEIEQFYKKAGDEYAKTHPGFKLDTLSA